MELPIAPQSYVPPPQALVRAMHRVQIMLARTTSQETELSGATAFVDAAHPDVPMANFAADLHVPADSSASSVLDTLLDHYQSNGLQCLWLSCNQLDWPADLLQAAVERGYVSMPALQVRLLRGYRSPRIQSDKLQIIPSRAAYAQLRLLLQQAAQHDWANLGASPDHMASVLLTQLDEPRVESYLGRLDGKPVGLVDIVSVGQIGVIKSLYVSPPMRRQGIAGRLMEQAVDFCRRAMFEQVILECLSDDPSSSWYDRLGFIFVAEHRKLTRRL